MAGGIAPQTVGKEHVLEFLHEHGQHPVGVGDGKAEPLRAAVPHKTVGKPVRVQPGKNGDGGQGHGGHLQRQHQQGHDGRGAAAEEERHHEQIPRLGEYAQGKEKEHQPRHPGQQGGHHDQQEAAQQEGKVADEPGHHAEKQVPPDQNAGVQGGDHRVVIAVCVFEHLAAEKIHGEFVQDVF